MSWLYSAFVGDSAPAAQAQPVPETVDRLCDRVVNSTLLEDRRAAVLALKELSRTYQLDVGTKAMPLLLHILEQDRADRELTKATLDTLINVCGSGSGSSTAAGSSDLGLQFSEILVKQPQNAVRLLDILEDMDFHVRYKSIELLKILLANNRRQLQDSILTSPRGVSRLMDLLGDGREVVRNEALLLLIDLTESNADIQKIIAFEDAFERVLQIVYAEGCCDGDVIVMDCLQLMENLLRDNVSNQNYFRESGLVMRLPGIFALPPEDGPTAPGHIYHFSKRATNTLWTQQRMRNVDMLLDVIRIFVVPENPSTSVNQRVMYQAKMLEALLEVTLASDTPPFIRAGSLLAAADMIRASAELQDIVASYTVDGSATSAPLPLIVDLIFMAIDNDSTNARTYEFQARMAATAFVQAYLSENRDAQQYIVSTFVAPPEANPNDERGSDAPVSAGHLLQTALFDWDTSRKDPFRQWFAAVLFVHALVDNPKSKEIALAVHVDEGVPLLDHLTHSMMVAAREDADVRVMAGFLMVLATWLHKFPAGVKHFLSLLEQMSQTTSVDPVIQGLAAFVVGICFDHNDDSVSGLTRSAIQSIIINRLGADQFISRLNRVKESRAFAKAGDASMSLFESLSAAAAGNGGGSGASPNKTGGMALPEVLFDATFSAFFKSTYEGMQRTVVNPKALKQIQQQKEESKHQITVIDSYKKVISDQDMEIGQLRVRIQELEAATQRQMSMSAPGAVFRPISTSPSAAAMKTVGLSVATSPVYPQMTSRATSPMHSANYSVATSPMEPKFSSLPRNDDRVYQLEADVQQLRHETAEWKRKADFAQHEVAELKRKVTEMQQETVTWKRKAEDTQQEMEDLLVCLAEQDLEMGKLREQLTVGDASLNGQTLATGYKDAVSTNHHPASAPSVTVEATRGRQLSPVPPSNAPPQRSPSPSLVVNTTQQAPIVVPVLRLPSPKRRSPVPENRSPLGSTSPIQALSPVETTVSLLPVAPTSPTRMSPPPKSPRAVSVSPAVPSSPTHMSPPKSPRVMSPSSPVHVLPPSKSPRAVSPSPHVATSPKQHSPSKSPHITTQTVEDSSGMTITGPAPPVFKPQSPTRVYPSVPNFGTSQQFTPVAPSHTSPAAVAPVALQAQSSDALPRSRNTSKLEQVSLAASSLFAQASPAASALFEQAVATVAPMPLSLPRKTASPEKEKAGPKPSLFQTVALVGRSMLEDMLSTDILSDDDQSQKKQQQMPLEEQAPPAQQVQQGPSPPPTNPFGSSPSQRRSPSPVASTFYTNVMPALQNSSHFEELPVADESMFQAQPMASSQFEEVAPSQESPYVQAAPATKSYYDNAGSVATQSLFGDGDSAAGRSLFGESDSGAGRPLFGGTESGQGQPLFGNDAESAIAFFENVPPKVASPIVSPRASARFARPSPPRRTSVAELVPPIQRHLFGDDDGTSGASFFEQVRESRVSPVATAPPVDHSSPLKVAPAQLSPAGAVKSPRPSSPLKVAPPQLPPAGPVKSPGPPSPSTQPPPAGSALFAPAPAATGRQSPPKMSRFGPSPFAQSQTAEPSFFDVAAPPKPTLFGLVSPTSPTKSVTSPVQASPVFSAPFGAPPAGTLPFQGPPTRHVQSSDPTPFGAYPPGPSPFGAPSSGPSPFGAPSSGPSPFGAAPAVSSPFGAPPAGPAPSLFGQSIQPPVTKTPLATTAPIIKKPIARVFKPPSVGPPPGLFESSSADGTSSLF